ncbi:MAG: D-glycero-beta-D-manno-heptose-7-phosphate kinase [Xanthobacteraceae bacterium]
MFNFEDLLSFIPRQTVLCVGDLMLDEFVYGEVSRISPEAPALVLAVRKTEIAVGGAGNVACNISSLGARCILLSVVGDDDTARALRDRLSAEPGIETELVVDAARPTTRKVRYVSEQHSTHLLRADWEMAHPIGTATEQALLDRAAQVLPRVSSVVLSDYAKGVLTPRTVCGLIERARQLGKPVIVDPKGRDFSLYRGATMITPNRQELAQVVRHPVVTESDIASAAAEVNEAIGSEAVLVTRSEAGMSLVPAKGEPVHISAYPVKVLDVSGAGDTVAAVLSVMLGAQTGFEPAMRAANAAAAVVVGKRGTATASAAELRSRILPAASLAPEEKVIFDWAVLDQRLDEFRRQGLRVGFTNGCFDLLHPGHIKLLSQTRAACDLLIVGLNSDASVRRLKGAARPVQEVHARAEVLAALAAVDVVVIFEQDTPLELIRRIRPRVLAKGRDYRHDQVVGHELVEQDGGEVILIDLVPGFSTTTMVRKSRAPQAG